VAFFFASLEGSSTASDLTSPFQISSFFTSKVEILFRFIGVFYYQLNSLRGFQLAASLFPFQRLDPQNS
jgi:hypothetical protein